ncbi:MAG: tripartite tricarboxylate transporter substrate binding protein [Polaromonas sp.]|nr:tripartite tricarboxylate transporter substrate binding protein [Polaromonas sp.]
MENFRHTRRGVLRGTAITLLTAAAPILAGAAAFPDKPIRLVVPFTAGGAADMIARALALRLGTEIGQQVIIDNRGGAGGTTAAEMVARAPADGYTLLFATMGTHAINPAIYPKLRYDPVKDFAPISLTHYLPRVLVVGPSVSANSVAELIVLAKKKPDGLTYGSAGSGSTGHLSGALFESITSVKMLHVPYKGSAPLVTDVLAGRVDMTFDSYPVYEEHIKSGRARPLAVTAKTRLGLLPKVPTLAESGLAGYEVSNWTGVMAPAGTPADIVARLNTAIVRAMTDTAMRNQLSAASIESLSSTPEAFGALIRSDIAKWAVIVKQSGATAD